MTTLITGGTGMVGSYVARLLIEKGERPVLFDLSPDAKQIEDIQDHVTVVSGNVLDLLGLIRLMKNCGVERVVHTAGVLALGVARDPVAAVRVNVEGGTNVLEAVRLTEARRAVFISTRQVYDFSKEMRSPVTEEFPKAPGGIYASTKLACEHIGQNYAQLYGVEFAALRFARVFGPGYWSSTSTPNLGTRAIKDAIEYSLRGQAISIRRPLGDRDEWLYARDAAQAVVCALETPRLSHAAFNIGSGVLFEFDEMVSTIRKYIPEAAITVLEHEAQARGAYQTLMPIPMDISRAIAELGYKPKYLLDDSIRDFVVTMKQKWHIDAPRKVAAG